MDHSLSDTSSRRCLRTAVGRGRNENVIDSDGTVIISHGALTGGSAYTAKMARKHGRPYLHLDMEEIKVNEAARRLREWIADNRISVLNVAGPRQSRDPAIYDVTMTVLEMAEG